MEKGNTQSPGRRRHRPAHKRPALWKRILRSVPIFLFLLVLVWVFGHLGILHNLERAVSDFQMRLNPAPADSVVAIVVVTDDDYRNIFHSTSPLSPAKLHDLVGALAKGEPAVIGIDVDTSAPPFATEFRVENWTPHIVWEREIRDLPEEAQASTSRDLEPLDVLGGQKKLNTEKNSTGLPLLIDDTDDKVTRRYRRLIATSAGYVPSFPFAVVKAYLSQNPAQLTEFRESSQDLLIKYSGSRTGSHRINLTAAKALELSSRWPEASPFKNKIVLLGGSYLGEDQHDTPVGRLTGVEILANVIETELGGGGYRAPSQAIMFLLEAFEAFALLLIFHLFRFRGAVLLSFLLVPAVAIFCSWVAYRNSAHFLQFALILTGMVLYECYEEYRSDVVTKMYHYIAGSPRD